MANNQTKASAKYQAKVGLISKSYKLKKEVVEQFAKKCEERNEAQSNVITRMMLEYINKGESNG